MNAKPNPNPNPVPAPSAPADRLALLLARGFGSGLAPKGPGTVGSLVGLLWLALLLAPGETWFFDLGLVASVILAVWACGRAETLLGQHDPGCIVLDEIVAVPLCFLVPLHLVALGLHSHFPNTREFLEDFPVWFAALGFIAFRVFDIWKPWPVRQVQKLPGGWGIVADDLLAAGWVNVVLTAFIA